MTRGWPADWEERKRGKDCPFCAEGRPEDNGFGLRVFTGPVTDAYLQRADIQRGYTVVIWRGRHVADPTELADEEAAGYWLEVLRVARAIERHFHPIKLNFDTLGNAVPHLHTHVVPRYLVDANPGGPPRFMMVSEEHPPMPEARFRAEVAALRDLLR